MKTTLSRSRASACALVLAALSITVARAEDYSSTDLQLLYTTRSKADPLNGTGTRDEKLVSFRFEHYGTFKLGDNYFNFDNYHGDAVGGPASGSFGGTASNQQFVSWMPRLSLGKLTGQKLEWGPLADVSVAARVEYASYGSYRAVGAGPSIDLKVPGFDYVQVRYMWRGTNYDAIYGFLHVAWGTAFGAWPLKAHFDGYVWTTPTNQNGLRVFAEPDLTLDVDPKGALQVGARLTHDSYKIAGASYTRDSPQAILKWNP